MKLHPEFERIRQETQSAAEITDRKIRESLAAERALIVKSKEA